MKILKYLSWKYIKILRVLKSHWFKESGCIAVIQNKVTTATPWATFNQNEHEFSFEVIHGKLFGYVIKNYLFEVKNYLKFGKAPYFYHFIKKEGYSDFITPTIPVLSPNIIIVWTKKMEKVIRLAEMQKSTDHAINIMFEMYASDEDLFKRLLT